MVTPNIGGLMSAFERALTLRLGQPVRIEYRALRSWEAAEPGGPQPRLVLALARHTAIFSIGLDPRLITRITAHIAGRNQAFDPRQPPDDSMLGVVAALIARVLDDTGVASAYEFLPALPNTEDRTCLQIDAEICIDDVRFAVSVGVALAPLAQTHMPARFDPRGAAELPMSLPLVVGAAWLPSSAVRNLDGSQAFLPGGGLWIDGSLTGRGVLIAPHGACGMSVQIMPQGKVVLGQPGATLDPEPPELDPLRADVAAGVAQVLDDVPVVVRVELGSVTLTARQWADLQPGDVLETNAPIGTEVTLRANGRALALGELLNIDGELGVRITKRIPS